jgi:hypothetical protein
LLASCATGAFGGVGRRHRGRRTALGCRKLDDLAAAHHAVGLLDLQVGQAAHGLGRHGALRGLLEITAVALGRPLEAVGHVDVLDVGGHLLELAERAALLDRGATGG